MSLRGRLHAAPVPLILEHDAADDRICAFAAGVALAAAAIFAARRGVLPFGGLEPGAGFAFPKGAVLIMERHGVESGAAGFGYAAFAAAMTLGRLTGDGSVRRFGGLRVQTQHNLSDERTEFRCASLQRLIRS